MPRRARRTRLRALRGLIHDQVAFLKYGNLLCKEFPYRNMQHAFESWRQHRGELLVAKLPTQQPYFAEQEFDGARRVYESAADFEERKARGPLEGEYFERRRLGLAAPGDFQTWRTIRDARGPTETPPSHQAQASISAELAVKASAYCHDTVQLAHTGSRRRPARQECRQNSDNFKDHPEPGRNDSLP